jgi:hypothetical protein
VRPHNSISVSFEPGRYQTTSTRLVVADLASGGYSDS